MKYALLLLAIMTAVAMLAGCAPEVRETEQAAKEVVAPQVTFESAPDLATTGQELTMSWKISGSAATTPHTAIHYGTVSVPEPKGPQDYAKATTFQCQTTPCSIPNSFSSQLRIDEPGTYYYRAHAIIDGKNVWSEEKTITIEAIKQAAAPTAKPATKKTEPRITVTSSPTLAGTNQPISLSWKIESESATTAHTAVHYGPSSVANPAGPQDYPFSSDFICTSKPCTIPRAFQAKISITETGTYYYRAHAIIDGKNVWSEEKTIAIVTPAEAPAAGGGGGGGY